MSADAQLNALADSTRRSIFEMLVQRPLSVGSIAQGLPVSRPAVSQHLRVLADAGLVSSRQEGARRVYSVRPEGLETLHQWLDSMWVNALDRFEQAAIKEQQMTDQTTPAIPPVIKTRQIPIPLDAAFQLFTKGMTTWWPLDTHSIGAGEDATPSSVRFEGRIGGRVVEVAEDNSECAWAEVIAWQPPNRVMLAWHPSRDPVAASILEVRFTPKDGGTELHLEHRGWEEFGDEGSAVRDGYDHGWDVVLAPFEAATVAGGE